MAQTFGQVLLEDAIPKEYRPKGTYTKKNLFKNMVRMAKEDPDNYVKTITEVKRLGDEFATLEGISVGLDDIAPLYKERDAIVKPALAKIKQTKDREAKKKIIADTQDKLIDYALKHPGTMGDMARSGSRGSPLQLMRAVGAPAAASDENDQIQPWLTTKSYSEGLRPSEWWATNREARMSAIKSNISVSEPGDLSKILVNNTSDQVVLQSDCGTSNGISMAIDDPSILDRFTARTEGTFRKLTLITPQVVSQLKKQRKHRILVRSPMTCDLDQGVCQKCMGLNATGRLNNIGENVGIRASHALGEPLTQFALNAKHGVRVSGSDSKDISGLSGFRSILESPASFKNKATLAPQDGEVTAINVAPQGGHYVRVGDQSTHVPAGLAVTVKTGQRVYAGDTLSEGVPRPDEVVKYKGLGAGRDYMVNKLAGIYEDSGHNLDRRHFEVLAKSTLNHMRIDDVNDDDSAEHGLVRGDVINYNRFKNIAKQSSEKMPIGQAEGKYLGESILYHLAGTKITAPMIEEFKEAGIKTVRTSVKAPLVTPIMSPATRNPLLNPDWLVKLGHRYLKQSILEGAQQGQTSTLHGSHPLPAIIFSAEFGEGKDGRY